MNEVAELELLKDRARTMGLTFSNNIGLDKLREKVNAALSDDNEEVEQVDPERKARLKLAMERKAAREEAEKLIRVRLTCMNPAKKEWPGEILTVANSLVGTQRKLIPFNIGQDGYHISQFMLNVLQEKQFQQFYTERLPNGDTCRRGRLVKEFAIEILPPLTEDEIKKLANAQAAAGGL